MANDALVAEMLDLIVNDSENLELTELRSPIGSPTMKTCASSMATEG